MADTPDTPAPEAKEKPAGDTAKGGGSKIVLVLLAVNCALLAGVLALLVRGPAFAHAAPAPAEHGAPAAASAGEEAEGGDAKAKAEAAPAEGEGGEKKAAGGPTVRLPDFIVHLRDSDADRYARLSFEVEVKEDKAKDVINARMPQIRDSFLAYLSDRTVDELRGSEAMAALKDALGKRLREIVPGVPVKALYVTDLVVQ
jgi:flagellar FliL protein